jgi:hypothetical protein
MYYSTSDENVSRKFITFTSIFIFILRKHVRLSFNTILLAPQSEIALDA